MTGTENTPGSAWYRLNRIARGWMILIAILALILFINYWGLDAWNPFISMNYEQFIVIIILFNLLVAWFLPLPGGIIAALSCFIGTSGLIVLPNKTETSLLYSMLIIPPGLFFLIFGTFLAFKKRLLLPQYPATVPFSRRRTRWIAGVGLLGILVFIILVQWLRYFWDPPNIYAYLLLHSVPYLANAVVISAGLVLAWFKPGWGGWYLILCSFVLFFKTYPFFHTTDILLPFLVFSAGIFFLKYKVAPVGQLKATGGS